MEGKRIGILCAMQLEFEKLKEHLQEAKVQKVAGMEIWSGTLKGTEVTVGVSGIGKVHAAICAQAMIDKMGIDAIINTGVGGGIHPDLKVFDLVASTKALQYDFDVTADNQSVKGYIPGIGTPSSPSYFEADPQLLELFCSVMEKEFPSLHYVKGVIATGDLFVADPQVKKNLWEQYHACVAEMEGAAVAQTAACNGIPFLVLRAISDLADDGAGLSYDEFARKAADHSAHILFSMLEDMSQENTKRV